ncbi:hypothetical protein GCM10025867_51160 (plasmid) [Frondihabitans sucicola]|uniref:Uncharacterized protein n=1 Tax=Frondihabitans sucicola TaxID=1268041 RepID=A0ABM8GWK3_9MICO|nr:hypothetical protein [Frondihabitans sucicola]BDZ52308.1 hypothetical protein GCM10025867_45490 [Frondihabitans sucicola]BDZ52875.1 hypothetical protein GCM10025867_51160 [Frondihabitans sucicola]
MRLDQEMPRTTAVVKRVGLVAGIVVGALLLWRFGGGIIGILAIGGLIAFLISKARQSSGKSREIDMVGTGSFRIELPLLLRTIAVIAFLAASTLDLVLYWLAHGIDVRTPQAIASAQHATIVIGWLLSVVAWVVGLIVGRQRVREGRPQVAVAAVAGAAMGVVQIGSWVAYMIIGG